MVCKQVKVKVIVGGQKVTGNKKIWGKSGPSNSVNIYLLLSTPVTIA